MPRTSEAEHPFGSVAVPLGKRTATRRSARSSERQRFSLEAYYRQIVQSTHEGIWLTDLAGITTFANPQMARMLGATPGEMLHRPVFKFVFPEDHATVRRHFSRFLGKPSGMDVQERLRRGDGSEMWALVAASVLRDARARPVGFLGMFTDISELKRSERLLRRSLETLEARVVERTAELQRTNLALGDSKEKYGRLFETISDAVMLFDGETKRVLEVNAAASRLYGYSRAEFLQLGLLSITAEPEDSEASIRLILAGTEQRVPLRYHRKKDGTVFPVEIAGSLFRHKGQAVICGIVRDISHSVDLERQILAVSEYQQRRLGQELHDDLCQQLAGIQFLSHRLAGQLAGQGAACAAAAREIADMVQRAMTQTRDLARGLSSVQLEAKGLAEALRELAASTRKIFGVNCRLEYDGPAALPNPTAAFHLYRIAQEAVRNSLKHGRARHIQLNLRVDLKRLVLTVTDDGMGFPRRAPKRRGMGLPTMQYRAELIGGSLSVSRRPRGGTAVTCTVGGSPAPAATPLAA